jgi:hypothetical protein
MEPPGTATLKRAICAGEMGRQDQLITGKALNRLFAEIAQSAIA